MNNNRRARIRESYGQRAPLRNTATALQYDPHSPTGAPLVIATGEGHIAEQIIALAKQNHIPIHDDPLLAAALSEVRLGEEIPPELYMVVAEVLAYLYRVSGKTINP